MNKKKNKNVLLEDSSLALVLQPCADLAAAPANEDLLVWDAAGKPYVARKCGAIGNPLYAQAGKWYAHGLLLLDVQFWARLPQLTAML